MNEIEKGTSLNELMQQLEAFRKRDIISVIHQGRILGTMQQSKLWKVFDHCKTWGDFCTRELGYTRQTASNYIRIAETYGDQILALSETPAIDSTRLVKLLPYSTPENVTECIDKASAQSVEAFDNNLKELQGKTPTDGCPHTDREPWEKCKCGKFFPVK
jgi:hypothetical protein